MQEIKCNGKTIAIFHSTNEWKEGLDFLTSDSSFIQAGTWWYQGGKSLAAHKHLVYDRDSNLTQEVIVILTGSVLAELYDENDQLFYSKELKPGDIGIMLTQGHGYKILEDNTKVVEIKNGPYPGAELDRVRL
jgi:hypothetical protein